MLVEDNCALQNSVELVRRVVEGIITDTEANPSTAIPVDVHLLHVAIIFVDGTDTEVREGIKLIMTRLQPHLIRLPMTCTWHAHILALRRPLLSLHHDQEMMVAYALCRKAARLGCSGISCSVVNHPYARNVQWHPGICKLMELLTLLVSRLLASAVAQMSCCVLLNAGQCL